MSVKIENQNEGFCIRCGFIVKSFDRLEQCPSCGSKGVPCTYENQVKVDINLHELRILLIWAENWAGSVKDEHEQANMATIVRSIQSRVNKQLPEDKKVQLLSDEIQDLDDVDTNITTI